MIRQRGKIIQRSGLVPFLIQIEVGSNDAFSVICKSDAQSVDKTD